MGRRKQSRVAGRASPCDGFDTSSPRRSVDIRLDAAAVSAAGLMMKRPQTNLPDAVPFAVVSRDASGAAPPRADGKLQCQRRGCGALYTNSENSEARGWKAHRAGPTAAWATRLRA
jgi:hypothetical protein